MRQAVGQASIREEVEDVVSAAQLEQAERQRHLDALEALRIYAHDIAPDMMSRINLSCWEVRSEFAADSSLINQA